MNTGRKGDFGALKAIQWFLRQGYEVFTPFSEHTKHDLIIVKGNSIKTVQCKYTSMIEKKTNKARNYSFFPLRKKEGTRGSAKVPYAHNSVDYFFVTCSNEDLYLIPGEECWGRKHIRLGKKYQKYKVNL